MASTLIGLRLSYVLIKSPLSKSKIINVRFWREGLMGIINELIKSLPSRGLRTLTNTAKLFR